MDFSKLNRCISDSIITNTTIDQIDKTIASPIQTSATITLLMKYLSIISELKKFPINNGMLNSNNHSLTELAQYKERMIFLKFDSPLRSLPVI